MNCANIPGLAEGFMLALSIIIGGIAIVFPLESTGKINGNTAITLMLMVALGAVAGVGAFL